MLATDTLVLPPEPSVEVTVRNLPAIEPVVSLARQAAHAAVDRTGHLGPYVVTAEGVGGGRVLVTVRLGQDASAPEWGLCEADLASALVATFRLLENDRSLR